MKVSPKKLFSPISSRIKDNFLTAEVICSRTDICTFSPPLASCRLDSDILTDRLLPRMLIYEDEMKMLETKD